MRYLLTIFALALLLGNDSLRAETDEPLVGGPSLRRELLARLEKDQQIRNELIKSGMEDPDKTLLEQMNVIDAENSARIKEIIHTYGWPTPALVGRDGVQATFIFVQHGDLELQQEMLPLVEKAYRNGHIPGEAYALLLDRVLVGEGKPQVYGTQAKRVEEWINKEPSFQPIEDEENVNARRASVGLSPLSDYKELLKRAYFPGEEK